MKVYGAGLLSSAAELQYVMDGVQVEHTTGWSFNIVILIISQETYHY